MPVPTEELRCSFCGSPRAEVRKLIAGPQVYICDRCIVGSRTAHDPLAPRTLRCSFCNKRGSEVDWLHAGPNVQICNECIVLCHEILGESMPTPPDRYSQLPYRRCGQRGLKLPAVSLGAWHNFGGRADQEEARRMLRRAFDLGVTHFDLANNYGPPPGSAETNVGKILKSDFSAYRDELILSTKAGYRMWPGPYGDGGSKKYLLASLDQSLQRLGVEYVDIFYHHRPDSECPIEESVEALALAVQQGKALYAAISNYSGDSIATAESVARSYGTSILVDQVSYSMLNRGPETGVLPQTAEVGMGVVAFSPLRQGLLSDKYLDGIPENSRAADPDGFLKREHVTPELVTKLRRLNEIAAERGESLAKMALRWLLKDDRVTTLLVGARNVAQLEENVEAVQRASFSDEELARIEAALAS